MWRAQEAVHQLFILAEQQGDDRLLVGEVVIQVAGRDFHVRGNVVGTDAAFALLVEQLQAVLHDALSGLHARGHAQLPVCGPTSKGHFTAYCRWNAPFERVAARTDRGKLEQQSRDSLPGLDTAMNSPSALPPVQSDLDLAKQRCSQPSAKPLQVTPCHRPPSAGNG